MYVLSNSSTSTNTSTNTGLIYELYTNYNINVTSAVGPVTVYEDTDMDSGSLPFSCVLSTGSSSSSSSNPVELHWRIDGENRYIIGYLSVRSGQSSTQTQSQSQSTPGWLAGGIAHSTKLMVSDPVSSVYLYKTDRHDISVVRVEGYSAGSIVNDGVVRHETGIVAYGSVGTGNVDNVEYIMLCSLVCVLLLPLILQLFNKKWVDYLLLTRLIDLNSSDSSDSSWWWNVLYSGDIGSMSIGGCVNISLFITIQLINIYTQAYFHVTSNGLSWYRAYSKSIGQPALLFVVLALIPIQKHNSILLRWFNISYDRAIKCHRITAKTGFVLILLHCICGWLEWGLGMVLDPDTAIGEYGILCPLFVYTRALIFN